MPTLTRPDEVEIHWESRGEGPPVVICMTWSGRPDALAGLIDDLVTDHRVIWFHTRGVGESTHRGPYDIDTDADDLEALLDELGAGPAVAVTLANATNPALRVAVRRPDLIATVITPGGLPLNEELLESGTSLASPSVIDALRQQIESDYRGATRTLISYNNPQMGDEEIRQRVQESLDYCPHEAALRRYEAWIEDDPSEYVLALGDRLTVLAWEGNPWFPPELADRARKSFPEMQVQHVEDGVLSRPDYTASAVRSATRARV
jgi:pimeloyl-ACP methyl ester carboxylesterase